MGNCKAMALEASIVASMLSKGVGDEQERSGKRDLIPRTHSDSCWTCASKMVGIGSRGSTGDCTYIQNVGTKYLDLSPVGLPIKPSTTIYGVASISMR